MPTICYTPKKFGASSIEVIRQAQAISDRYSDVTAFVEKE